MKNIIKIVDILFGSHLYGTNTEQSDKDYKGVYMPTITDLVTLKYKKSITNNTKSSSASNRNTADDVDAEFYALQYFIKLCCEGQTTAFDMLHAPESCILESHWLWQEIVKDRHLFYTNNLTPFLGYAQQQAAKYGIKGSRLNAAIEAKDFLDNKLKEVWIDDTRLYSIWHELPQGEHSYFVKQTTKLGVEEELWQVCGKKFSKNTAIAYVWNVLEQFVGTYGERAKLAAENKGIDWKAMSHALRAAYQVIQLYTEGTITFPLREAEYLKKVKYGQLHYNEVSATLEDLIDRAKLLASKSLFPETVNEDYWNSFIVFAYHLDDFKMMPKKK